METLIVSLQCLYVLSNCEVGMTADYLKVLMRNKINRTLSAASGNRSPTGLNINEYVENIKTHQTWPNFFFFPIPWVARQRGVELEASP